MRTNIQLRSRGRMPATEAFRPGSRERLVGADGNLNAGNSRELMQTMASLMQMVANGDVMTLKEQRQVEASVSPKSDTAARREVLTASYHDQGRQWAELGAAISADVSVVADREGFMRRMLLRVEVPQGQLARIRVRQKNVVAITAAAPMQVNPVFLRDIYFVPPEFYVKANIRVEEKELMQGSGDILEDKFFETQEAIMVTEDRTWKKAVDDVVGASNDLQILAGGLTPASLSQMRTQVMRWGIPAQTLLLSADIWDDIIGQTAFSQWFDPVSQYEIVMTGNLGNLLGMSIYTDAFREPTLKVLNQGEMYIVSSPELHGTFTDRGPVQSQEVNNYADGVPARGWSFWEMISLTIHNTRSVVKAVKA